MADPGEGDADELGGFGLLAAACIDPVRLEIHPLTPSDHESMMLCRRLDDRSFMVRSLGAHPFSATELGGIPIEGVTLLRQEPDGQETLLLTLARPMGDLAFAPDPALALDGGISFEQALAVAVEKRRPVFVNRIREAREYWFFPILEIGSFGYVVSKRDGAVTNLGSAWGLDEWLWGYERGLLLDPPAALRVEEVFDVPQTRRVLAAFVRLEWEVVKQLREPPVVIPEAACWRAIRSLREDGGRSFRWTVQQVSPA